jgi:hypothetical protein
MGCAAWSERRSLRISHSLAQRQDLRSNVAAGGEASLAVVTIEERNLNGELLASDPSPTGIAPYRIRRRSRTYEGMCQEAGER